TAQWGGAAVFDGAQWGYGTTFQGAQWGDSAAFRGAQWAGFTDLIGAQWGSAATFQDAQWGKWASFQGAQWGNNANFQGAQWGDEANFSAKSWEQLMDDYLTEERWIVAKEFAARKGLSPNELYDANFEGVTFLGRATFTNRALTGTTNFGPLPARCKRRRVKRDAFGCVVVDAMQGVAWEPLEHQHSHATFGAPPNFRGCKFSQQTGFEAAQFAAPSGAEEAVQAYHVIKLAFMWQQAKPEEQRFFRLEMAEKQSQSKGLYRVMLSAHEALADYGLSATRPLRRLVVWPAFGFALVYMALALGGPSSSVDMGASAQLDLIRKWLVWSLTAYLPLPAVDLVSALRADLFGSEGRLRVLALLVEAVQKIAALAAILLTGFSLRHLGRPR
ncbi:MAG: hypothetical protein ACJA1Y_001493, partial [Burkholderiaceae bacterium]